MEKTMTDDEIITLSTSVAANAAGQLKAVAVVLRAMQSLPGFDHKLFIATVATYQAALEKENAVPEEARTSFDDFLELLCRPL
jgi:hypothetical protein